MRITKRSLVRHHNGGSMASWRQDKSPKSGSVMKPQSVATRIMTRRGWKITAPKSSDNMSMDADWKPLWNAGYRSGVGLQLSPGLVLSHQPWADSAGNGSELQQRSTTVNRERMKTSEGGRGARRRGVNICSLGRVGGTRLEGLAAERRQQRLPPAFFHVPHI